MIGPIIINKSVAMINELITEYLMQCFHLLRWFSENIYRPNNHLLQGFIVWYSIVAMILWLIITIAVIIYYLIMIRLFVDYLSFVAMICWYLFVTVIYLLSIVLWLIDWLSFVAIIYWLYMWFVAMNHRFLTICCGDFLFLIFLWLLINFCDDLLNDNHLLRWIIHWFLSFVTTFYKKNFILFRWFIIYGNYMKMISFANH